MISLEIYKFPYCGQRNEQKLFLSDKIVLVVRKKTLKSATITIFVIACFTTFKPEAAQGVTLPLPVHHTGLERVQESQYKQIQSAPFVKEKKTRIKFDLIASRDSLPFIYIKSRGYLTEDVIKKIRAGWKWGGSDNPVLDIVLFCGLLYAITHVPQADAFVNELFKQLGHLNAPTVQQPSKYFDQCHSQHTSIYGSARGEESKNDFTNRELGQVTSSQTKTFLKADSSIDIEKGYQEILRRAENSDNFECSKERFLDLCTENGTTGPKNMQEAITVLQLEADGHISNVRRDPIAAKNGLLASDFIAEDRNGNTIHVEAKGPVGSAIKIAEKNDPSIDRQGKSIAMKLPKQISRWIDNVEITPLKSPRQVLVVFDLFDVPVSEKGQMQRSIELGLGQAFSKTDPMPMILFINNIRNR